MGKASKRWNLKVVKFTAQHGCCCYCDGDMLLSKGDETPQPPTFATFEHVRERALGGQFTEENLKIACKGCNKYRPHRMPGALYRRMRQHLLTFWPACTEPSKPVRRALARLIPPIGETPTYESLAA